MNQIGIDYSSSEYLRQWIETSWPTTSASAYAHYRECGRGVFAVNLEQAEPWDGLAFGLRAPTGYLTPEDFPDDDCGALMHKQVATYDPERQVVFLFVLPVAGIRVFVGKRDALTPRQAYEQREFARLLTPEITGHMVGYG